MDSENYFDLSFLFPCPFQYHPNWFISDPLAATTSYTQPPQAAELHLEFNSQTSQVSQVLRDQETVGLPGL